MVLRCHVERSETSHKVNFLAFFVEKSRLSILNVIFRFAQNDYTFTIVESLNHFPMSILCEYLVKIQLLFSPHKNEQSHLQSR
jgi:hypothetical protein